MIGIIDVGGGTRGIYGAGVFDYLLDHEIHLPYCIGVSAGSANGITYLAGQRGRTHKFYTEYAFRKEYMSMENVLKTGSYVDLDYIYCTLSEPGGECPLDYEAFAKNNAIFKVVATDAETGKAVYFTDRDIAEGDYRVMCASCTVPVVCQPYPYKGHLYYDGGLSDPIPVDKAFHDGCDKVIVVLTRHRDQYRKDKKDIAFAHIFGKKYPKAARRLVTRANTYNSQLDYIKDLEKEGKVLIIAPDDIGGMKTLTKDHEQLTIMYEKGYKDAEAILDFIKE